MAAYFCRVIPPRSSFALDMTDAERAVMIEHVQHWSGRDGVVAFGPVAHPDGAFGVAVMSLPDGETPEATWAADPLCRSGIGFKFEFHPMPQLVVAAG
jgi:hypothetical protein